MSHVGHVPSPCNCSCPPPCFASLTFVRSMTVAPCPVPFAESAFVTPFRAQWVYSGEGKPLPCKHRNRYASGGVDTGRRPGPCHYGVSFFINLSLSLDCQQNFSLSLSLSLYLPSSSSGRWGLQRLFARSLRDFCTRTLIPSCHEASIEWKKSYLLHFASERKCTGALMKKPYHNINILCFLAGIRYSGYPIYAYRSEQRGDRYRVLQAGVCASAI